MNYLTTKDIRKSVTADVRELVKKAVVIFKSSMNPHLKHMPQGELPYREAMKIDLKSWRERREKAGKSVTTELPTRFRKRR